MHLECIVTSQIWQMVVWLTTEHCKQNLGFQCNVVKRQLQRASATVVTVNECQVLPILGTSATHALQMIQHAYDK